jgi:hypothetical protein
VQLVMSFAKRTGALLGKKNGNDTGTMMVYFDRKYI